MANQRSPFTGQYYERHDFIMQTVKILIVPIPFICWFGWLCGIVANFVAFWVYYQLLFFVLGYDRLSALDEFFLLDNAKNRANVISVIKMDRVTDLSQLKVKIFGLTSGRPRLEHKLTKFGGEYFFVRMSK
jgi:hypothetical protein